MKFSKGILVSLMVHILVFGGTLWIRDEFKRNNSSLVLLPQMTVDMKWVAVSSVSSKKLKPKMTKKIMTAIPEKAEREARSFHQDSLGDSIIPCAENLPPDYPEHARRQGLEGKMLIQLTLDQRGYVVDTKIIKGHEVAPVLQRSALKAVREWKFIRTGQLSGSIKVILPVTFSLETT